MQHFNAADFIALSPAKAKAQALAMFGAAQIDSMPDWQAVAYALHSVVTRKRGKAASQDETAMQDSADAVIYAPWLDYEAKGKGTAILRGRVTVTFADGWSRTVGLLQAKGKGWSIGKAVQFAVACYEAAAARRMCGNDGILYSGEHYLAGLISVPEISSVESADSDETVAGDLIWDPVAANAATRELRAGQVDPATYQRGEFGEDCALSRARFEIGRRMGLMKTGAEIHMIRANHEAVERAGALLFPWDRGRDPARVQTCANLFALIMEADPEGYVMPDADDPRATLATVDHFTALAASEIVGGQVDADALADWSAGLSAISYRERFLLVEDALLAWPAMVDPCAFAAGEPVQLGEEEGEGQHEDTTLPPTAGEAEAKGQPGIVPPAAVEDVAEPAPRVKPRYRVRADGSYELVK